MLKRKKRKLKNEHLQKIREEQCIRRKRRLAKGRHNYNIKKHASHASTALSKGVKIKNSLLKKYGLCN